MVDFRISLTKAPFLAACMLSAGITLVWSACLPNAAPKSLLHYTSYCLTAMTPSLTELGSICVIYIQPLSSPCFYASGLQLFIPLELASVPKFKPFLSLAFSPPCMPKGPITNRNKSHPFYLWSTHILSWESSLHLTFTTRSPFSPTLNPACATPALTQSRTAIHES